MLNKLAFTGIKSRLKDYIVLFFGLVMSSAIFYMFESLATNHAFIAANSNKIPGASFIFLFGAILLTIITLVYIFYANSFLMSMRRHDYGLLMMLGAKQSKIGQLILVETTVMGTIASVIGALVGWGLTASVGSFLMSQMIGSKLSHFSAFYLPAVLITVLMYIGLFLIAGLINRLVLTKTPALKLLKGDSQPNRARLKPLNQVLQVILGLALLSIGYLSMIHIKQLQLMTFPIALITIVFGTYFLFNAIFIWVVVLFKQTNWANRGLGNFTLSQLSFRIRNYTKILSIVSILFALALGAITVGMGLHRQISSMATANTAYTMAVKNPSSNTQRMIAKLHLSTHATYHQKQSTKAIYYSKTEFKAAPLQATSLSNTFAQAKRTQLKSAAYRKLSLREMQAHPQILMSLQSGTTKPFKLVSQTSYDKLPAKSDRLTVFRVKDLSADQKGLKRVAKSIGDPDPSLMPGSYGIYVMGTGLFGGLEFMGFFLGIAFLAMLASCLMFKILSGAASDQHRYDMLNKIGTRPNTLRGSITKEILVLFALPAIVGVIHVLFGLQMFKVLMLDPYNQIWLPFTIFLVLYMIYYVITVLLYEYIVIPKLKIDQ